MVPSKANEIFLKHHKGQPKNRATPNPPLDKTLHVSYVRTVPSDDLVSISMYHKHADKHIPYIANRSRWNSFADGQGTSNSLEKFRGSFALVKMCS